MKLANGLRDILKYAKCLNSDVQGFFVHFASLDSNMYTILSWRKRASCELFTDRRLRYIQLFSGISDRASSVDSVEYFDLS